MVVLDCEKSLTSIAVIYLRFLTTIDIIRYLKAMSKAEVAEKYIKNNSDVSLWFDINNSVFEVNPGSMLVIQ